MISSDCWFREYLKIYCPGCGGTRMIRAILRLDFYQAFRYNPLAFCILVITCFIFFADICLFINKKKMIIPREREWVALAIIVLVYFLLRNIPLFNYLIPTEV